jgi:hypothetical protein
MRVIAGRRRSRVYVEAKNLAAWSMIGTVEPHPVAGAIDDLKLRT